jgi:flavin reductase (DIM6/NTAB) family NADH-FMN oxidoreductase RutF
MQKEFSLNDILALEQRYRATFINSLDGFKSLALICTVNKAGQTNLAIFNSLFHLGANPPLFGFIIRHDSAERHTLNNIISNNEFTVNHVSESFYKQAHQTPAQYPADRSGFDATGLNLDYKTDCKAPFVKERHLQIIAEFVRKVDVIENGTLLIIAKIKAVYIPENCIGADGYIDLEKAGSITCSGLDSYHRTTQIARLAYAKPDAQPTELN